MSIGHDQFCVDSALSATYLDLYKRYARVRIDSSDGKVDTPFDD